jgi:hypothetical protein
MSTGYEAVLRNFLQAPVTSSVLGPDICLSAVYTVIIFYITGTKFCFLFRIGSLAYKI